MAEARYKITADDRSNKAIRSARQNLVAFRKSVLNVRTAMVALAGAAAMGAAIKKSADYADGIDKARQVSGLTAETLQELRFAFGQLADVTDEQVDLGLQKFRRRLDLARDGMGASVKVLDKLNISLEQDTGSALEETIDKLQELARTEDIAGEASQLFGEEIGPKLAAAIEQGNLDELREHLHEIGGVLSGEAAAGSAEFNDELDKLSRTLKTQLTEAILSNKEEIIAFVQTIQTGMVEAIKWIGRMQRQWEVSKLDQQIEDVRDQIELLESGPTRARGEERGALVEQFGSAEEAIAALNDRLDEAKQKQMELLTGGGGPSATLFGGVDADSARESNAAINENLALLERIDAKRKEMTGAGEAGMVRGGNPFEAYGEAAEAANDEVRDLDSTVNRLNMTFSSAFEDAIIAGNNMRDVLRGLLQDVARIILRMNVTQPLGNALAQGVTDLFSGGGTQGVAGNVPKRQFATGGIVDRPTMALAGEAGPEAFFPLTRRGGELGLRGSGGGGNITMNAPITIDARGADKGAIVQLERVVEQINRSIEQRAVAAVAESRMRG